MSETQQQIPLTTPLGVTLSLQQWRDVLDILNESGPLRKVGPLFGAIEHQCRLGLETMVQGAQAPSGPRPNGAAHSPAA